MSTRHLRRVQQQKEAELGKLADHSSEEESEEETTTAAKPFNPFDLLSDDEEVVCDGTGCTRSPRLSHADAPCNLFQAAPAPEEEEEEDQEDEQEDTKPVVKQPPAKPAPSQSRKKKKKGKGKKADSDEAEDEKPEKQPEDDVDIDALVQELNLTTVRVACMQHNFACIQAEVYAHALVTHMGLGHGTIPAGSAHECVAVLKGYRLSSRIF